MVSLEERTLNSVTCAGAVALCFAFLLAAVFPFVGGDALGTALRAESQVAKTNSGSDAAKTSSERAADDAERVRCPDCDKKGKIKCQDCGGKGLRARQCPTCNGKGRRPCRSCTKGNRAERPGKLKCGFCGGRGTVGKNDRVCPRCGGDQVRTCTVCLGRGYHPCRKQIFDKVCPSCRFVGKIACMTCNGEMWLTPEAAAARAAKLGNEKPKAVKSAVERERLENNPQLKSLSGDDESLESLQQRYAALSATYDSHYDIFVDDLRPHLENFSDLAKALARKLKDESGTTVQSFFGKEKELQRRIRRFESRWQRLYEIFLKERRTYRNCKDSWDEREEAKQEFTGGRLKRRLDEITKKNALTLRIAAKPAIEMIKHEPETLLLDADEIKEMWRELDVHGQREVELAKARHEAAVKEAKAKAAKAKAAALAESERSEKQSRTSKKGHSSNRDKDKSKSKPTIVRPQNLGATFDAETQATSATSRNLWGTTESPAGATPKGSASPSAEAESSGGFLKTFGAILLGFAVASLLFSLRGLWQRRSDENE